jgi:2,3-diketo-5-methylthiopentyl-1-phosphate enolase
MRQWIKATYAVAADAPFDTEKKAKGIALGQTTDTWTPVARHDQDRLERHRGAVLGVSPVTQQGNLHRATLTIGFPPENTQGDIATLLVMIFGKVSLDGRIKLIDLELPPAFLSQLPGPRLGISGVRKALGVEKRPLAMAIFKPCVGLPAGELARMFRETALGGIDIVKDDEILPDLDVCPTEQRLAAIQKTAAEVKRQTGHTTLYAVNLTGPPSKLAERARMLVAQGANCLLFNVLAYGYGALEELARDPKVGVPIMAHPALAGAIGSAPHHGIAHKIILGTLMRAGGADIVLFPSSYGTVALPKEDTDGIRDALTADVRDVKTAFPVPSAGIHPGVVPQILADYGSQVIVNAGGGVFGHPKGATAGAKAIRQAIDLATGVIKEKPPELAEALQAWGR